MHNIFLRQVLFVVLMLFTCFSAIAANDTPVISLYGGVEMGNAIYACTFPGLYLFMLDLQIEDPVAYEKLRPHYSNLRTKDSLATIGGILFMSGGLGTVFVTLIIYFSDVLVAGMCNFFSHVLCLDEAPREIPSFTGGYLIATGVGVGVAIAGGIIYLNKVTPQGIRRFYTRCQKVRVES